MLWNQRCKVSYLASPLELICTSFGNRQTLSVTWQSFYSMTQRAFKTVCCLPVDKNTNLIFVALVHSKCLGAKFMLNTKMPH